MMKCSKCGSKNVYHRTEGHPDTKGCDKAMCGDCGHKAVIREWDNTQSESYTLDGNYSEPEFKSDSPASVCSYCNKIILSGQPSVPDKFGEEGYRMHLDCSVAEGDGMDVEFG